MLNLIILTGPNGSGKTTSEYFFEENGFFVVSNLLPNGVKPMVDGILAMGNIKKAVFIVSPNYAEECIKVLKSNFNKEVELKLVLLNCDLQVLLSRFKLTRHVHPSTTLFNTSLENSLKEDIAFVTRLESYASILIDTTNLDEKALKKALYDNIINDSKGLVTVRFISFGQKNEKPLDIDLLLDTRVLPNPYWIPELKQKNGLDPEIVEYLESFPLTTDTVNKMIDYLTYYLKWVQIDGRGNYTIGVCCSGGKHRSVYVAETLGKHFSEKYRVLIYHRDINKK